jgi:hypothetical protein
MTRRRRTDLAFGVAFFGVVLAASACGGQDDPSDCDIRAALERGLDTFHSESAGHRQATIETLRTVDLPDDVREARDLALAQLEQLTSDDAFDTPTAQADYLAVQDEIDTVTDYLDQSCSGA